MPRGWGAATGGNRSIARGPADYFEPGTWNARCWTCFRKCKASEMLKLDARVGNGWVCWECFETVNPQEYVRGIPDNQMPPWTQPDPPPIFIDGQGATSNQVRARTFLLGGRLLGGQLLG